MPPQHLLRRSMTAVGVRTERPSSWVAEKYVPSIHRCAWGNGATNRFHASSESESTKEPRKLSQGMEVGEVEEPKL